LFAEHSWYFRNALVRANYENLAQGVYRTEKYLVRLLANVVFGENNSLKNREMHIRYVVPENVGVNDTVNDTVFNLIKINPNITAEEIRIKLNIGIATAKRRIKILKDRGMIERIGSDKTGHWEILHTNISK
jgi:predicted HTH transcriptional regulator